MFKYTDTVINGSDWSTNCFVDDDLLCLKGHFPTQSIFPAIAQLEMVIDFISEVTQSACIIKNASLLKFVQPILPKDIVKLVLDVKKQDVIVYIYVGNKLCTRGKLTFLNLVS
ncbi:MAG: hypothetical protein R8L53_08435 [Mariprofundales bacterium]